MRPEAVRAEECQGSLSFPPVACCADSYHIFLQKKVHYRFAFAIIFVVVVPVFSVIK